MEGAHRDELACLDSDQDSYRSVLLLPARDGLSPAQDASSSQRKTNAASSARKTVI